MRQAFAGAHAGVEGEEPEFSSGDEGGWESLPTRTAKPTRCCEAARRAQHRRMRQAFAGAHAGVEGEEREFVGQTQPSSAESPTKKPARCCEATRSRSAPPNATSIRRSARGS